MSLAADPKKYLKKGEPNALGLQMEPFNVDAEHMKIKKEQDKKNKNIEQQYLRW